MPIVGGVHAFTVQTAFTSLFVHLTQQWFLHYKHDSSYNQTGISFRMVVTTKFTVSYLPLGGDWMSLLHSGFISAFTAATPCSPEMSAS